MPSINYRLWRYKQDRLPCRVWQVAVNSIIITYISILITYSENCWVLLRVKIRTKGCLLGNLYTYIYNRYLKRKENAYKSIEVFFCHPFYSLYYYYYKAELKQFLKICTIIKTANIRSGCRRYTLVRAGCAPGSAGAQTSRRRLPWRHADHLRGS